MQVFSPGDQFGDFRLVSRLDSGGQGQVWVAESDHGQVAVKLFDPATGNTADAYERFSRELAAVRDLRSPNVARVWDYALDDDPPWIAYERIPGASLSHRLVDGPLPLPEALSVLADIALGLADIHAAGIAHCDLKPANVICAPRSRAVILDLGAASFGHGSDLSRAGFGTPGWMSPEQTEGHSVTVASDLHNLGRLLVKVITGHQVRAEAAWQRGGLDLRGVPTRLLALTLQCLDDRPSVRPAAADAANHLASLRDELVAQLEEHERAKAAAEREFTQTMAEYEEAKVQYDQGVADPVHEKQGAPAARRARPPRRPSAAYVHDPRLSWECLTMVDSAKFWTAGNGKVFAWLRLLPTPAWGVVIDRTSNSYFPDASLAVQRVARGTWYGLAVAPKEERTSPFTYLHLEPLVPEAVGEPLPLPCHCPSCDAVLHPQPRHARGLPSPTDHIVDLFCPNGAVCRPQVVDRIQALVSLVTRGQRWRDLAEAAGVVGDLRELFDQSSRARLAALGTPEARLVEQAVAAAPALPDDVLILWIANVRGGDTTLVNQDGGLLDLDLDNLPPLLAGPGPDAGHLHVGDGWQVMEQFRGPGAWRLDVLRAVRQLRAGGRS